MKNRENIIKGRLQMTADNSPKKLEGK